MGSAASPLSLAATGLSAVGQISAGNTAANNAKTQGMNGLMSGFLASEDAQLAADVGRLKANQTNTFLLDRLNSQLSTADAIMGGTGATSDSPSNWAVRNRAEKVSNDYRTTQVGDINMQASADQNAAQLYMMSGLRAMDIANGNAAADRTNGLLAAGGTLLKGISGVSWS